jgi:hypothetical protein
MERSERTRKRGEAGRRCGARSLQSGVSIPDPLETRTEQTRARASADGGVFFIHRWFFAPCAWRVARVRQPAREGGATEDLALSLVHGAPRATAGGFRRAHALHGARVTERYRSGQTGQTVNLLAHAFGGSNPPLSTMRVLPRVDGSGRGSTERQGPAWNGSWQVRRAGIAQLARARAFQARGRGFESRFPLQPASPGGAHDSMLT